LEYFDGCCTWSLAKMKKEEVMNVQKRTSTMAHAPYRAVTCTNTSLRKSKIKINNIVQKLVISNNKY
jgi:hypothetical protein